MIGPQSAKVKSQLGPLLNGIVNYEYWMPVPQMDFPGVSRLMEKYQQLAADEGLDALGFYVAPLAYAQLQVLEQAINATQTLDEQKLSAYCRQADFTSVMGEINFGAAGEWNQSRVIQVQFQHIEDGNIDNFRDSTHQVVVSPAEYASGELIYPYAPES